MTREIITVQVGQCGNQIGRQFWQMILKEHVTQMRHEPNAKQNMSTFFRSYGTSADDHEDTMKARAILVDMEQGPVNTTLKGPLGNLFDHHQLLTDVAGSGNNWANGYCVYGPQYRENLIATLHKEVELCDSLQSFFLLHSTGGGTGSGLGTYILGLLEDEFPNICRFTIAIFPSSEDDVITSPYNSILALDKLIDHADCVMPIQNEALIRMISKTNASPSKNTYRYEKSNFERFSHQTLSQLHHLERLSQSIETRHLKDFDAFGSMNIIVAQLLADLTASVRFEGSLNVDINDITTNLVPYPKLHFLTTSIKTIDPTPDLISHYPSQKCVRDMFERAFDRDSQFLCATPQSHTFLACGYLARGRYLTISDVNDSIHRIQRCMKMVQWNQKGFKVGLCSVSPIHHVASVLYLSNNSCLEHVFQRMLNRMLRCYKRRAHVHHYLEYMDHAQMDEALEQTQNLIQAYNSLQRTNELHDVLQDQNKWKRLIPLV